MLSSYPGVFWALLAAIYVTAAPQDGEFPLSIHNISNL